MFHGCVLKRGLISPVLAEMPNSKFSENLSEAASGFFFLLYHPCYVFWVFLTLNVNKRRGFLNFSIIIVFVDNSFILFDLVNYMLSSSNAAAAEDGTS